MAVLKKSPLEFFLSSYVKQKRKSKVPAVYINKAIVLISEKLENSCCDPDAVVNYHTFRDNLLTRTVRSYLSALSKEGNVKSLERSKAILETFRDGCC